jgi:twitching motility protein PilT
MKAQAVTPEQLPKVLQALQAHAWFKQVSPRTLQDIVPQCLLGLYAAQETILQQGDKADALVMVLRGQAAVRVKLVEIDESFELTRLQPGDTAGELDLLLEQPRRTTVVALDQVTVLQVTAPVVRLLFETAPQFGLAMARVLAGRVQSEGPGLPVRKVEVRGVPPADVLGLLPLSFIERQRVVPVHSGQGQVTVGFVDDPAPSVLAAVVRQLSGTQIVPVRISPANFQAIWEPLDQARREQAAQRAGDAGGAVMPMGMALPMGMAGAGPTSMPGPMAGAMPPGLALGGGMLAMRPATNEERSAPKLDPLLRRLVSEGGSDLHLSAGHRPRWRIDGEIREIVDAKVLGDVHVYELLEPAIPERNRHQFLTENDTDFAYEIRDLARFRVNLFRDNNGVCAVMRVIPSKILTMEQLGLPEAVRRMCDHPKGLVLVTGPTGSGKSTTLAAMVDYINRTRRTHILTMEDPIEFVHKSQKALVNQREVGPHTAGFGRALRAALREDPDIVLVGEMRDTETIQLALETANTGHLVFGTLHTSTAISTMDRIIDVFPPEQQSQVRTVVSDVIKGVVSQTLLKRRGGGRVAALEILVGSPAVANLVREGKNHQISNILLSARNQGNQLLNDQLEKLVQEGEVEFEEALLKAIDKADLSKRFGKEYFER